MYTYLAARYRRIASRRGPVKAVVAVEHAMLIAIRNIFLRRSYPATPRKTSRARSISTICAAVARPVRKPRLERRTVVTLSTIA